MMFHIILHQKEQLYDLQNSGLGPEYLVLVLLEYLVSVLVLVLRPLGT